jgi:signal transduction histidine kinase
MSALTLTAIRKARQSIRLQLIVGTVFGLTLALALFGLFVRYVVASTLIGSVDRDLRDKIAQAEHRPPPHLFGDRPAGEPPPDQAFDNPPMPGQMPGDGQSPPPYGFKPGPPPGAGQYGQPPQLPMQTAPFDQQPGGFGPGPPLRPDGGMLSGPPHFQGAPNPSVGQEDSLDRPRRFSPDGRSLDRFNSESPWDLSAIVSSSAANKPIYSTVLFGKEPLRLLTQPVHPPFGPEWLFQAAYPLGQVNAAIAGVDQALFTLIPIALVVAALGGGMVTRSVVTRVGQMGRTAAGIQASDLSRRLPVVGSDEFSELAETFNALIARLEMAFQEQARVVEQQRRFTADASHELKTPLTVIRGTTSLALSGDGILNRQSTEAIDDAASSMAGLVQDLILLARSDAAQLGRSRIDILLAEPLLRAVGRLSPVSKAPIKVVELAEDVIIYANEDEMIRLFSNILLNASQHTQPAGEILVSMEATEGEAIVTIADSGVGIAPQHLEHLCERFYRVDSSRTRGSDTSGGSGLGLAICKEIVNAHNGTLKVKSVVGKGTSVIIALPRKRDLTGRHPRH